MGEKSERLAGRRADAEETDDGEWKGCPPPAKHAADSAHAAATNSGAQNLILLNEDTARLVGVAKPSLPEAQVRKRRLNGAMAKIGVAAVKRMARETSTGAEIAVRENSQGHKKPMVPTRVSRSWASRNILRLNQPGLSPVDVWTVTAPT